jgi:imidazolonepropionase-like amidohydrolase
MRGFLGVVWMLPLLTAVGGAQEHSDVAPFVSISAPVVVLNHVRVVDGTGSAAKEDQALVMANGKIQSIGPAGSVQAPAGAQMLDRAGYTVIPGIVGMHNHLYYTDSFAVQVGANREIGEPGLFIAEVPYTAPRLYLAAGVTTMRTTGSVEPYTDLKVKHRIDENRMPGPSIDATAPYLEGSPTIFAQMHELSGPDDARRTVAYWADEGMTSFKAYMNITRAELGAAIEEAHRRKLKLTGHLCSVTWREAIDLGIDDLEHGILEDTEFVPDKKPDVCPSGADSVLAKLDMQGAQVQQLIRELVSHHVAVTSTLPVFESSVPGRPRLQQRVLNAMSAESSQSYLTARARVRLESPMTDLLRKEMEFEMAFVKGGGLLLAGPDPTGNGGVLPGFGDQREIELLVEAGFTPVQAIQIATENGAKYLGQQDRIGTLVAGKQADVVLIKGDPSKHIDEIENVETVFKAGVGYDSAKLIEAVRGQVGIR